jgi:hypothetical protein
VGWCRTQTTNVSASEDKALALPLQERAKLIERLLESLETLPEQQAEALCLDAAERRAREIDEDNVQELAIAHHRRATCGPASSTGPARRALAERALRRLTRSRIRRRA